MLGLRVTWITYSVYMRLGRSSEKERNARKEKKRERDGEREKEKERRRKREIQREIHTLTFY